ncbi:MAG: hypothetical protein IJN90_04980 [Bacilli bacterium]|nr:hypothetical protein [Bacilli bacterium]
MANLIVVSGPQAVGKMTVAESLRDKIGYSLMVNHDSIEVSDKIFERGSDAQKDLNRMIREAAFSTAIKYDVDMIFTFVTAYDMPQDIEYLNNLRNMFENTGGSFYFVELSADLQTRLERNVTPHRLESKLSKNDIERSTKDLINTVEKYRLNSLEGEMICPNHIKIDNTNLSPDEVTDIIVNKFNLSVKNKVK